MAGRKADSFQPELPSWLVEGMAAHLQSARLSNWALEPDMRIARSERNPDPLGRARQCLRAHPSLTLNELTWPTEEQLADDDVIYQSCAQLFVYELLRLRKGAECLDEMLAGLPQHLNWQTAFLQAFNAHFQRLIDVDKWWALNVIHFVGRDLRSSWPTRASWDRLEEILSTPVQVRLDPKELPISSQVKLQHVITEWDYPRQTPVLMLKLNHLQALRLRTSPDLAGLVEDYRQVIESYLRRRNQAGVSGNHKLQPENHGIVADTLKRLDALDAHREMLRKSTNAPPGAELTITP
jgi:hypothetical protein